MSEPDTPSATHSGQRRSSGGRSSGWSWLGAAWFFAAVSLWGDWESSAGLDSDPWQPWAIGAGLVLFFVLNVLVTLNVRRGLTGLVALGASVGIAWVLISTLAETGGNLTALGWGFWVALPVPVCGAIGGLKALLADTHRGYETPTAEGPLAPPSP
jgi:hypothetical protein